MTIVLVGAPGSGKSTIGALVAERLQRAFVDVDQVIVETTGREISDIFASDGEAAFRALEEEHTLAALTGEALVSLGGGAVMNDKIREGLTQHTVVWLDIPASVAAERVGLNVARPLLLGNVRGRLNQLLKERKPLYQAVATHTVDAAGEPEQVADAVTAAVTPGPETGSGEHV